MRNFFDPIEIAMDDLVVRGKCERSKLQGLNEYRTKCCDKLYFLWHFDTYWCRLVRSRLVRWILFAFWLGWILPVWKISVRNFAGVPSQYWSLFSTECAETMKVKTHTFYILFLETQITMCILNPSRSSRNSTLVEKRWNSCKISCKRMHYSWRNLTRSCNNRFIITSFFQDFKVSYKILAIIALSSQCF